MSIFTNFWLFPGCFLPGTRWIWHFFSKFFLFLSSCSEGVALNWCSRVCSQKCKMTPRIAHSYYNKEVLAVCDKSIRKTIARRAMPMVQWHSPTSFCIARKNEQFKFKNIYNIVIRFDIWYFYNCDEGSRFWQYLRSGWSDLQTLKTDGKLLA